MALARYFQVNYVLDSFYKKNLCSGHSVVAYGSVEEYPVGSVGYSAPSASGYERSARSSSQKQVIKDAFFFCRYENCHSRTRHQLKRGNGATTQSCRMTSTTSPLTPPLPSLTTQYSVRAGAPSLSPPTCPLSHEDKELEEKTLQEMKTKM